MIKADSEPVRFGTRFSNGAQTSSSDTTADKGGRGCGFRPHELLEAALATCMNISLRMWAQKYEIPLADASVVVSLDREAAEGQTFRYKIELQGSLSAAQKAQLLSLVESCPVRTTLSKGFRFVAGE